MNIDYDTPWYHGSPLKLSFIHEGSTITQNIDLAKAFSHKSTILSVDSNIIKHNGAIKGYLYIIDENIADYDIYQHPKTTMEKGMEWLTGRDLKVRVIEETIVADSEIFTDEELIYIENQIKERKNIDDL
jgi:hypothetical protein